MVIFAKINKDIRKKFYLTIFEMFFTKILAFSKSTFTIEF